MNYLKLTFLAGLFFSLAYQAGAQNELRSEAFSAISVYSSASSYQVAAVSANFQYYANNKELHLANTSTGPITAVIWSFGDGYNRNDTSFPVHRFKNPGVYNVCLTVTGPGSSDTRCQMINIQ